MVTVVKHKESGKKFILAGTGFGAHIEKPSFFLGNKIGGPKYFDMICCINKAGELGWFKTEELEVLSIDGTKPEDLDID